MKMARPVSPAQNASAAHILPPNRILVEGAATPFIVHGHRHACLYRAPRLSPIPFIVLKICKRLRALQAMEPAYLVNNEAAGGAIHA
jgi:hypothetical protein